MRLIVHLRQQHLPALNPINLNLSLLAILEIELGNALELVFLRHRSSGGQSESRAQWEDGSFKQAAVEDS